MFTTNATPYYTPSGRAPVGGLLTMLIGGLAAAWILSIPYIYLVRYIPSAWFCAGATAGYGFALAYILNTLLRIGKIRSTSKAVLISFIVGLGAVWFQWVFFCAFIFSGPKYPMLTAYIEHLNPMILLDSMSDILGEGTWSFGKNSRTAVHGPILAIIWVAEALTIIGISIFMSHSKATDPYSEALDKWAPAEKLPYNPQFFPDIGSTKIALESGDFGLVLNSEKAPMSPCSEITLHAVEGDRDCHFFSLSNLTVSLNKKGKEERKVQKIVEYLRITPELHQKIRAKFGPTI